MSAFSARALQAQPFISVVIPTYARPDLLRRCLNALVAQDYPSDRFEIIVIEDGGPGVGKEVVDWRSRTSRVSMRYFSVARAGPAAARNRGWRAARGEIIAFTDDDTIPDRRWLAEGARSMESGAEVVSGRILVPLSNAPIDSERNVQKLERATLATCNAFCRRPLLESIGGFDARFTRAYREDSDLEFTLREAGAQVDHNPFALVVHPPRTESRFVSLRQQRNQFFDALLYRKHPEQFRESIRARPPIAYYSIVLGQIVMLLGILRGRTRLASLGLSIWLPLVLRFYYQRARGTHSGLSNRVDLFLTSVVIPPVAIYWRLRGALHFRVPFL
jgi:GT2 family glycosyltransferase